MLWSISFHTVYLDKGIPVATISVPNEYEIKFLVNGEPIDLPKVIDPYSIVSKHD